jgi:hypothetical protein
MPFFLNDSRTSYKRTPDWLNALKVPFGDPYAEDVVLYLKGDGVNLSTSYVDSSPSGGNTITGNASSYISTTKSKYGGSSIYRSGTFSISGANLFFHTGNFTVEAWINVTTYDNNYRPIITIGGNALYFSGANMNLYFGSDQLTTFTHGMVGNEWSHIAMTQSGTTFKVFVNGMLKATHITRPPFTTATTITIGASNNFFYIDSLRVTKAVRYQENFNVEENTFLAY